MLPIRTILHPTDFSENSKSAFRVARAVARDCGARLVLLHVVPLPVMLYGPAPEAYLDHVQDELEQIKAKAPKTRVEHWLVEGDPVSEILSAAKESDCDLIVMGTHGRAGLGRLLTGSVAEQVLRKAPCPVLTVKVPLRPDRPVPALVSANDQRK
jgi:nucleotide-binding universal stress UspA family protein